MEVVGENVSPSEPLLVLPRNSLHYPITWRESPAIFTCRLCMKTFYNKKALQNHKKTQHDADDESREGEFEQKQVNEQDVNSFCDFKFIPLQKNNSNEISQQDIGRDGFITRTFSEDTTYLIIKIEKNEIDSDAMKRSRLDGVVKRAMKPKQLPIDLRGPFTCTFPSTMRPDLQCRQIFFNCCDYSLHYREEHTKRRKAALRCQVCEKRLDRDNHTDTLAAKIHDTNRFTVSCRICSLIFLDSSKYDEHNRIVHAKLKPHQCSICPKRFTQQGGLQQHMRMHTGVRPFVCTFCPKAFTQKAGLDQHLRTHTKVKPFKCVICSKCFSQSVHLRQHMRTHTNIQPFECSVCDRRFKQSSHLNFHMRSHVQTCDRESIRDTSLIAENYVKGEEQDNQMEFLKLANLHLMQDEETLYYTTELTGDPADSNQDTFSYQPQTMPDNVLSL